MNDDFDGQGLLISFKMMSKFFNRVSQGNKASTIRIPDEKFSKLTKGQIVVIHEVTDEKRKQPKTPSCMMLTISDIEKIKRDDLLSFEERELTEAYGDDLFWKTKEFLKIWLKDKEK